MLSSTVTKNRYVGVVGLKEYSYTFKIFDETNLVVIVSDEKDTLASRVTLVLDTDYTVSGVGSETGGDITLLGDDIPVTSYITIYRNTPKLQGTQYADQTEFKLSQLEQDLDEATMKIQELSEAVGRSPKVSVSSGLTGDGLITAIEGSVEDAAASATIALMAQTAAERAQSAAETAQGGAQTAQGVTEGFRDETLAARDTTLLAQTAVEEALEDIEDSFPIPVLADVDKVLTASGVGTAEYREVAPTAQGTGNLINGVDAKTTPIDADMLGLMDSETGNILKKLSWANLKATLKTYFDTLYSMFGMHEIGSVRISFSNDKRTNEAEPDGSAISRTTYSALFAKYGTTYGSGDGSTTFNIPDSRECALVHIGTRGSGVTAHDVFTLGQFKDDQGQGHIHKYYMTNVETGNETRANTSTGSSPGDGSTYGPANDGTNGTPRQGLVTRGKRLGVYFFIRLY